jgi:hypothetical protein
MGTKQERFIMGKTPSVTGTEATKIISLMRINSDWLQIHMGSLTGHMGLKVP